MILAATAVSKPLPLDDGEGSLIQLVLYIPVVYNILANDSALRAAAREDGKVVVPLRMNKAAAVNSQPCCLRAFKLLNVE
jgi:hypothetical protein